MESESIFLKKVVHILYEKTKRYLFEFLKRKRMTWMKKNRTGKLWTKAFVCGFILTVLLSFTGFSASCDLLTQNMLRLHVVANSDGAEDQRIKLAVRDAVLLEAAQWYGDAKDFDTALAAVCTHLESIEKAANRVLRTEGVPYRAAAEICDVYFPTRVYEDITVPAGKYRTLRIRLGEGDGKNWWCVLFPTVCVSGASDLTDLPAGAQGAVSSEDTLQVRFKTVEIFTRLRELFDA